jgi:hypothetical protein
VVMCRIAFIVSPSRSLHERSRHTENTRARARGLHARWCTVQLNRVSYNRTTKQKLSAIVYRFSRIVRWRSVAADRVQLHAVFRRNKRHADHEQRVSAPTQIPPSHRATRPVKIENTKPPFTFPSDHL